MLALLNLTDGEFAKQISIGQAFHWASRIYRIIRIIFFATFRKKVAKPNPPSAE
jgi:hypothetical protein